MTIAKLEGLPEFDLGRKSVPWKTRRAEGKALRDDVPRESHAEWRAPKNRPNPVATVLASNKGRQEHLIPLRMGRMAASPFAFLRGSACVMAADLSTTPISRIPVVMDGDAHLNNFGMYGTPQGEVVFDLNDFDEAVIGPWEWDLKRLVASVNVAGRQNGLNRGERATALRRCVKGYRFNAHRLQDMGALDIWYLHAYPGRENPIAKADPKSKAVFRKTLAKAMHTDNRALMPKVADRKSNGSWTFRDDPPVLTRVDKATNKKSSMHSTVTHSRYPVSVASCWATIMSPMLRTGSWGLVPWGHVLTWCCYSEMARETLCSCRSKRRWHPRTRLFCLRRWGSFSTTENEWSWDKELSRRPLTRWSVTRRSTDEISTSAK